MKLTKPTLLERITAIRDEVHAFIDAKAEEMKAENPGIPVGVLRNMLTAGSGGCQCRAYLDITEAK
ncbi:hypothetical protein [Bradyrhizobium sp. STM 3557]|uniref:hypothetical protein n=1 Tax=Bradyrhizobium sp. STM 3557 TaxID=578920 RepID=UPI00388D0902